MIDRLARRLLVVLATLASVAHAEPVTYYVGTYTGGTSRGIYRLTFDSATGELSPPALAGETKNPLFLAESRPGGQVPDRPRRARALPPQGQEERRQVLHRPIAPPS